MNTRLLNSATLRSWAATGPRLILTPTKSSNITVIDANNNDNAGARRVVQRSWDPARNGDRGWHMGRICHGIGFGRLKSKLKSRSKSTGLEDVVYYSRPRTNKAVGLAIGADVGAAGGIGSRPRGTRRWVWTTTRSYANQAGRPPQQDTPASSEEQRELGQNESEKTQTRSADESGGSTEADVPPHYDSLSLPVSFPGSPGSANAGNAGGGGGGLFNITRSPLFDAALTTVVGLAMGERVLRVLGRMI